MCFSGFQVFNLMPNVADVVGSCFVDTSLFKAHKYKIHTHYAHDCTPQNRWITLCHEFSWKAKCICLNNLWSIYPSMHRYIYVSIHLCVCESMYLSIYASCISMYLSIYMSVNLCICTCIYAIAQASIIQPLSLPSYHLTGHHATTRNMLLRHTNMSMHVSMPTYACIYVCIRICVCVCVCVCVYIYIHTHIHHVS